METVAATETDTIIPTRIYIRTRIRIRIRTTTTTLSEITSIINGTTAEMAATAIAIKIQTAVIRMGESVFPSSFYLFVYSALARHATQSATTKQLSARERERACAPTKMGEQRTKREIQSMALSIGWSSVFCSPNAQLTCSPNDVVWLYLVFSYAEGAIVSLKGFRMQFSISWRGENIEGDLR